MGNPHVFFLLCGMDLPFLACVYILYGDVLVKACYDGSEPDNFDQVYDLEPPSFTMADVG